jgi:hypothetical protein
MELIALVNVHDVVDGWRSLKHSAAVLGRRVGKTRLDPLEHRGEDREPSAHALVRQLGRIPDVVGRCVCVVCVCVCVCVRARVCVCVRV